MASCFCPGTLESEAEINNPIVGSPPLSVSGGWVVAIVIRAEIELD